MGFREKVDSRKQFISNAMGGVLEVSLGLSQGATQHTLVDDIHISMPELIHTHKHSKT